MTPDPLGSARNTNHCHTAQLDRDARATGLTSHGIGHVDCFQRACVQVPARLSGEDRGITGYGLNSCVRPAASDGGYHLDGRTMQLWITFDRPQTFAVSS
jgi:hypothetical protein